MKGSFLKVAVLLTVGFGAAFADSNQGLSQEEKVSDQKSVEIKDQDALDRLNNALSKIPQSVRDCVLSASTVEELKACHK